MMIIGIILLLVGALGLVLTWTGAVHSFPLLAAQQITLTVWGVVCGVGLLIIMLFRRPMN